MQRPSSRDNGPPRLVPTTVQVIDRRPRDIGGFQVGRLLPAPRCRMVGPFTFLDHMGPVTLTPENAHGADVRPHPHIGLSTVTYLFEGEITHRDSLGFTQAIRPGEINWMTAGRGITHSERFERARTHGDVIHGVQAWVALPREHEETAPAFAHHGPDDLPLYEGHGLRARLLAGSAFGAQAGVRTHSPLFYVHWELAAGGKASLPAEYTERAAYIVSGGLIVDGERQAAGRMLVFAPGSTVAFEAESDATVMLLGGEPVGPRFIDWNFVSSTQERIEQAKRDWREQRMPLPAGDADEFVPLPEAPARGRG
jgi:redox-sensitive bicupin YhaK (pirin superfamily)